MRKHRITHHNSEIPFELRRDTRRAAMPTAYFATVEEAGIFAVVHAKGYPAWRIVEYKRGFAVQTRPGGDYFALDGLPTLMERGAK